MSERTAGRVRLRARDVMTSPVITVRPDTSVKDIAAMMLAHHISGLPVVTPDGELMGIVTEADLLHKESASDHREAGFWKGFPLFGRALESMRKVEGVTAAELMSSPVVTVEEQTPLREVAALMVHRKINRAPVLSAGWLVGIISRNDVLRAFVRPDEEIAQAVRGTLLHDLWIDVTSLKIDVREGIVYLDGQVDRRSDKVLAERWAAAVDGVVKVESTLTYEFDDRNVAVV